jgi:Uma2 family endonuclease
MCALALSFESIQTISQPEFAAWVAQQEDGRHRCELLNGRVVMNPPAGYPHGRIEGRAVFLLSSHVDANALGVVFGSSQGFELPTGDTVEPDASFVTTARWDAAPPPEHGAFLRIVPDLVVEILSPGPTAARDRGEKKAIYERAGVREYWIVDPLARTATIFTLDPAPAETDAHSEPPSPHRTCAAAGRYDLGRIHGPGDRLRSRVVVGLDFAVDDLWR